MYRSAAYYNIGEIIITTIMVVIISLLIIMIILRYSKIEKERSREEALEKDRGENENRKDKQRQFIAEQRRLMSDKLRYEILKRDGFRCQICGATQKDGVRLHVDHIYPISKGGKTVPENLRTLCERCNMGKGDSIENDDEYQVPTYVVGYKTKK